MKITKEMRRIIERQINKKCREDYQAEYDRRRDLAASVNDQLLESAEYKALLEAEKALEKKIDSIVEAADGIARNRQYDHSSSRIFVLCTRSDWGEKADDMFDRIIMELSCGNDLDEAKEILKKYGIEL